MTTLRWRHNERDSASNHQPHHCLLKRLFKRRSKKASKLRVTGLCAGKSAGTGEFLAQMASNAENVSIWWHHHEITTHNTAATATKAIKQNGLITSRTHCAPVEYLNDFPKGIDCWKIAMGWRHAIWQEGNQRTMKPMSNAGLHGHRYFFHLCKYQANAGACKTLKQDSYEVNWVFSTNLIPHPYSHISNVQDYYKNWKSVGF